MFERYTEKARRVIFFSHYEAQQCGSAWIDTGHLLLGLMREDSGIARRLSRPPVTIEFIRKRIEEQSGVRQWIGNFIDIPLSAACPRVLANAAGEAGRLNDECIGTNHLLLALLREKDCLAAKVLAEAGLDTPEFRDEIARMSDATRKIARRQQIRQEDYIEIHGELWGAKSVRELDEYYGRFDWEKRQWQARDALVRRSNQRLRLHAGQSFDPEKFELQKGGWSEDHCVICWGQLCDSNLSGHGEGYTNGQDWICTECHDRLTAHKGAG